MNIKKILLTSLVVSVFAGGVFADEPREQTYTASEAYVDNKVAAEANRANTEIEALRKEVQDANYMTINSVVAGDNIAIENESNAIKISAEVPSVVAPDNEASEGQAADASKTYSALSGKADKEYVPEGGGLIYHVVYDNQLIDYAPIEKTVVSEDGTETNTYSVAYMNDVASATPSDYIQVKAQVEANTQAINNTVSTTGNSTINGDLAANNFYAQTSPTNYVKISSTKISRKDNAEGYDYALPEESGTIALTSDLETAKDNILGETDSRYLHITGGDIGGDVSITGKLTIAKGAIYMTNDVVDVEQTTIGATLKNRRGEELTEYSWYWPGAVDATNENYGATIVRRDDVVDMISDKVDKEDLEIAASLSTWYPDGSVKSVTQFTSGLEYVLDSETQTAKVKAFSRKSAETSSNFGEEGCVVIPPFVEIDELKYTVTTVAAPEDLNLTDVMFSANTTLTKIIAPITITEIEANAFDSCISLVTAYFPGVTNLLEFAFSNCNKMESISIPKVRTFGRNVFFLCSSLGGVEIPNVEVLGDWMFDQCAKLDYTNYGNDLTTVPTLGTDTYININKDCKIIVPDALYDAWITNGTWQSVVSTYKVIKYNDWEYARRYELETFKDEMSTALNDYVKTNHNGNVVINGSLAQGGGSVKAKGSWSHAEGHNTEASAFYAHAEGGDTKAAGANSHAEGVNTLAQGTAAHAEGRGTEGYGGYAHVEGYESRTRGNYSHADGYRSQTGVVETNEVDGATVVSTNYHHFAYTWQGHDGQVDNNGVPLPMPHYNSHGPGTFNVNPVGGTEGFYIGENSISTLFADKADKSTTLEGYGITDVTYSNGVIQLGKSEIQVTDKIVSGSEDLVTGDAVYEAVDTKDYLRAGDSGEVYKAESRIIPDFSVLQDSMSGDFAGDILYESGKYIMAGGFNRNGIWHSFDGLNWVKSLDGYFQALCYKNGIFVAGAASVVQDKNGLWYSEDGINWTQSNITDVQFKSIAYGNGMFLAAEEAMYNGRIYVSSDGRTWTLATDTWRPGIVSVLYFSEQFVAIYTDGTIFSSSDGVTWKSIQSSSASTYIAGVVNGHLIVVQSSSTSAYVTEDLETWETITMPSSRCSLPCYFEGEYYCYSTVRTTSSLYVSSNLNEWTSVARVNTFYEPQSIIVGQTNAVINAQPLKVTGSKEIKSLKPLATKEYVDDTIGEVKEYVSDAIGEVHEDVLAEIAESIESASNDYIPRSSVLAVANAIDETALTNANEIVVALKNLRKELLKISEVNALNFYLENVPANSTNTVSAGTVQLRTGTTYTIDWGDGIYSREVDVNSDIAHVYTSQGNYKMRLLGDIVSFNDTRRNSIIASYVSDIICDEIVECSDFYIPVDGSSSLGEVDLPYATNAMQYANCGSLSKVSLANVTSLRDYMFDSCGALTEVYTPNATNIGNYAFRGCSSLEAVEFPSADFIVNAFSGCTSLREVNLPKAGEINGSFSGCTSLTTEGLSLPSIEIIYGDAFRNCSLLHSFSSETCKHIWGDSLFDGCTSITNIYLPNAILGYAGSSDAAAFSGCTKLELMTVMGFLGANSVSTTVFANVGSNAEDKTDADGNVYKCEIRFLSNSIKSAVSVPSPDGISTWSLTQININDGKFPWGAPTTTKFTCADAYIVYDNANSAWKIVSTSGQTWTMNSDGSVSTEGELNSDGTLSVEGELNSDGTLSVEAQ